jgi:hypothetical protein
MQEHAEHVAGGDHPYRHATPQESDHPPMASLEALDV